MRKLALWHTRTFKPIMTHDELEPIMATLGFVGLPPTSSSATSTSWKEYAYTARGFRCNAESGWNPPQKPRLPYPKIDGLHIYTYGAFVEAVCFYLEMSDISDLFHIRFAFALCSDSLFRFLFYCFFFLFQQTLKKFEFFYLYIFGLILFECLILFYFSNSMWKFNNDTVNFEDENDYEFHANKCRKHV